jgi:hypothetical protein
MIMTTIREITIEIYHMIFEFVNRERYTKNSFLFVDY